MLSWITHVPLVLAVLILGGSLKTAAVNTNGEDVTNQEQRINGERPKPQRYWRRRILQVEDSPIFKDDAFGFIETSSKRITGRQNKRSDAAYRPTSMRNVADVDIWSRLLQSDMSMSMPTPTSTDAPSVSPTTSPVITETDVPTIDAPAVMETNAPTKTPSEESECDSLDRTNVIRTLLEDVTDLPDDDLPIDSPQGMAFDWITNVDNATDPCTDAESTFTRFALATLYYSTNGENWTDSTNWVSSSASQCTWYGIACNDDGDVDALQLGTPFLIF